MFQVDLNLLRLLTDLPFDTPMMMKIRKDHWHYNLIEQVSSPLLHTLHSFQVMEQEQTEPWFQLQLISQCAPNKGKMLGEATIRIQEWPMGTVKSGRIRLSSLAWLDIELSYKYVSIASAYPNTIKDSPELKLHDYDKQSSKNDHLKLQISKLREEYARQKMILADSMSKNSGLVKERQNLKKQTAKREELQIEKDHLAEQLQKTNYVLTSLMNLVISTGDSPILMQLNEVIENKHQN